ncbi:MAG TPA: NAD-dependent epimerase/dehydratase family protein [Gemmatimonadales bacterium]
MSSEAVTVEPKVLRVALVGCGRISTYHIAALAAVPAVEIVAVCDLNEQIAREVATHHGIRGCYTDVEAMLREAHPDVMHILTPPQSHLALARVAVRYQVHLYIEKPMAATLSDAQAIADLAREAGVQVCPGHSRLFEPVFLEACRRIRRGDIGQVISVRAEQGFTYESAARSSSIPWSYTYDWGIFDNLICHPLYLACHFLKQPGQPKVVSGNFGLVREAAVEEVRALIPSSTGIAEVTLSLSNAPEVNRMEIVGTRGRIMADWQTMTVLTARQNGWPSALVRFTSNFVSAYQLARSGCATLFGIARGRVQRYQGLRTIVAEFYQSLRDGTSPPVTAEAGVLNARLMEEIRLQCEENRKPRPLAQPAGRLRPRVLVTGGSGFLGGRLLQVLSDQNIPVRGITRLLSRARHLPGIEWVQSDLAQEARLRAALCDIETVYHCAALCGAPGSLQDYEQVNVEGTRHLLRLAAESGVKNFIYLSSMSVYAAPSDSTAILDEDSALDQRASERGAYTQSKLAADQVVLEFARQHRWPRVIVLRPGTLYGPGAKPPTGRFQLPSPQTRPLVTGSPDVPAGLVYVDDVVEAMLAAARSMAPTGRVYNLINPAECTQGELARTLTEVTGGRVRPIFAPYPLVWSAMLGVDLLSLPRHRKLGTARYRLKRTLAPMRFECTAARQELGWRPRVPLATGLARTFDYETRLGSRP